MLIKLLLIIKYEVTKMALFRNFRNKDNASLMIEETLNIIRQYMNPLNGNQFTNPYKTVYFLDRGNIQN